jgi:restriction system protein
MPIPEFNAIKAPALQLLADGKPRKASETYGALAEHFSLTAEDRAEVLPSGAQRRWENRVLWALYDLYRAGMLERPMRGTYLITDSGRRVAEQKPKVIDREFLMQFPQFVQWVQATATPKTTAPGGDAPEVRPAEDAGAVCTPEETIDSAYQVLQGALKKDVLDLVKRMDPLRFEQLVLDLLVAMGYGGSREEAARVTKASQDEGIDGVINEDRLGLDVIYLQAKRWQQTVGRKEIQSFVGALAGQQANKGIFITTSDFTDTAIHYARKVPQKVVLIDGDRLADLMIQHNIGVSRSHAYEVKHVDSDYFEIE